MDTGHHRRDRKKGKAQAKIVIPGQIFPGLSNRGRDSASIFVLVLIFVFAVWYSYGEIKDITGIIHMRERSGTWLDTARVGFKLDVELPAQVVWRGGNALELRGVDLRPTRGRNYFYVILVEYQKSYYVYRIWGQRHL